MLQKEIFGYVKAVGEEGRGWDIEVVCSTDAEDRDGEIIDQAGWQLDAFRQNPVFLAAHQHRLTDGRSAVIGSFKQIGIVPNVGLVGRITFANTSLGQEYKTLYRDGHQSAVSVGFLPLEQERIPQSQGKAKTRHVKAELLEVSAVAVGSNRGSLTTVREIGGGPAAGVTRGQVEAAYPGRLHRPGGPRPRGRRGHG
jgi:HK97 family phage prohead protease